ncbi:MAG TPA: hypothetical protein VK116_08510, partial [Planctomycetota bacterium]|nr:hypothetical protein [Planctomycetota bacterium]
MSEKEDAPWRDRSRAAVTVNGIDSSNGNGGGPALSHGNGTHRSGDASHHAWPTVWGLDPRDLHDRFWASRGIEVIRPGDSFTDAHEPSREYLLTTSRFLFTFPINRWLRALERLPQRTIALSIRNERSIGCREITVTGDDLQLTRFQRQYDRPDQDLLTVYLTRDPELARKWAKGDGASEAEAMAQAASSRARRITYGHVFDTERQTDVMAFVRHLLQCFTEPGVAIGRTRRLDLEDSVWIDRDCSIPRDTKFIGPVWIGAGREVPPNEWIVGPTVLWDDPAARPVKEPIAWSGLEPVRRDALQSARKKRRPIGPPGKRAFDVLFSLVALALTLPLYPFVLLLIWLEDRRP